MGRSEVHQRPRRGGATLETFNRAIEEVRRQPPTAEIYFFGYNLGWASGPTREQMLREGPVYSAALGLTFCYFPGILGMTFGISLGNWELACGDALRAQIEGATDG